MIIYNKWLFWIGMTLVVLSFVQPWLGNVQLGRLPGDFHWSNDDGTKQFYFPLGTCLIASLLLYLLQKIIYKL